MHLLRNGQYTIDFPELRAAAPGDVKTKRPGAFFQFLNPNRPAYRQATLYIAGLAKELRGLRIMHLSDVHFRRRWGRPHDELISRLQANPPDLILFTGDFIDDKYDHRPAIPLVRRLIQGLRATSGIYAILGNHDPDVVRPHVAEMGVRFVSNRRAVVPAGRGEIELIGLPGLSRHELDMGFIHGLPAKTLGVPRVVLCHYPDLFCAARHLEPDIYLAGHTHGGQICMPSGKPILRHDVMPPRFCKGVHRIDKTWFAVSNGFGFTSLPVRLFCPAEVVEFTLTDAETSRTRKP